ncbi:NAD(P)-binding protein [Thozetella sp. PMI_491]|nr:NAD(P)-binding protein [Thozetella sp. PMI_491]
MARIITVFGSTGLQGGSVVRHLSSLGTFTIRAITRNVHSEPAQNLAKLPNVTTVPADMSKPETLLAPMQGAEAVFAITNYYDSEVQDDPFLEVRHGCNLADKAKEAGVGLFIWSGVPSALVRSGGRYKSNNLVENKSTISQYLRYKEIAHVNLNVGFYLDNWVATYLNGMVHGALTRTADGSLELTQPLLKPEAKQGMIWIEKDLGAVVAAILSCWLERSDLIGNTVWAAYGHNCMSEVVAEIGKQSGCPVRLVTPTTTGIADLDELYGYENEFGVLTDIQLPDPLTSSLGITFHGLEDWVREEVIPSIRAPSSH